MTTDDPNKPLAIEDRFYEFLAGGAMVPLLTSMVDLQVDKLLAVNPDLTADEIIARLHLDPVRGNKWILLLRTVGLVVETPGEEGGKPTYKNGPLAATIADQGTAASYFYREFLRYWRQAASHEMVPLLKGAPVHWPVRYPPVAWDDVVLLHEWMRSGALITLEAIQRRFTFEGIGRLLDVGGGDGTMACALAPQFDGLKITIFNLPQPAWMCRENIAKAQLEDRVSVVSGDFRVDPLPGGYDMVMFSRVMADWDPATCRMLAQKAWDSLVPGGRLLIAEPLRDQNPNLALVWEHSYLPYDDFGAWVYKPSSLYEQMFAEVGYTEIVSYPRDDNSIHSVITCIKPGN